MKKDNILIGLALGTALPFIGYAIILEIYDQLTASGTMDSTGFSQTFRQRTTALLAICTNLIPFMIFNRQEKYNGMRGVIIPTVVYVMIWLVYFRSSIL